MRICKNCNKSFPFLIVVDGKIRNLGSRSFCLDCSPFGFHNTRPLSGLRNPSSKIEQMDISEFNALIKSCKSRSEVFEKLNMRKGGASFKILNRRLNRENTDISHFLLGGALSNSERFTNEELFTYPCPIGGRSVRDRVLKYNLISYICKECKQEPFWNNKILILQLDHVNGIRNDNRLENLRFLCPNCHTQTDTFGAKRRIITGN